MNKIIPQYSRISHHTIYGTNARGVVFTKPNTEDFTDGTWRVTDLCRSEIGVNEEDKKMYIRIGDDIKEVKLLDFNNDWNTGIKDDDNENIIIFNRFIKKEFNNLISNNSYELLKLPLNNANYIILKLNINIVGLQFGTSFKPFSFDIFSGFIREAGYNSIIHNELIGNNIDTYQIDLSCDNDFVYLKIFTLDNIDNIKFYIKYEYFSSVLDI